MEKEYEIEVYETVRYRRLYRVVACSAQEAEKKALEGDTVEEETVDTEGVVDRELV
jgi:hypothetical protein